MNPYVDVDPHYHPLTIHLASIPIPPHKHLYKVTYDKKYCKYYYSDSATIRDFMKHINDTDITNVEYMGRVFPDD